MLLRMPHFLRVVLAGTSIFLKTHSIYTRHFVIQMFSYPIQLGAMYYIWTHALGSEATNSIFPYYAVVFMLQRLQVFGALVRVMGDMVTSGDIVLVIARPFHLWQVLLGRSLARALGTLILGAPVVGLALFLAKIPLSFLSIGAFLITASVGFMIEFLLFFCVGLTSFWTDRTWGQTLMAMWLVEVLGGRLVPLFVLPQWAQGVLRVLPFVHIAFTPASVLLFPDYATWLNSLLQQLLWFGMFILMATLLWHRGVQRYQGYGI